MTASRTKDSKGMRADELNAREARGPVSGGGAVYQTPLPCSYFYRRRDVECWMKETSCILTSFLQ